MSHGDVTKIALIHRHQLNFPSALSLLVVKQWGLATYASLVATATFPIAFSDTSYIGVATGVLEDDSQAYIRGILRTHKTTSSCLFRASETGGPAAEYVVIGR